jgi:hypothetical protein
LGGTDDEWNLVPQFEHWQGKPNGEWRMMEITLRQALENTKAAMLVEVGYGRGGLEEDHEVALAAFEGNRLRSWDDPRIPDFFRVRVWTGAYDGLVLKIGDDSAFDHAVTNLTLLKTAHEFQFNLGTAMPQPDRSMYVVQAGLTVAKKLFSSLGRTDSFGTFMCTEGTVDAVRDELEKQPGIDPTESRGMQALPILVAEQQGLTVPKLQRKYKAKGTKPLKRKADVAELGFDVEPPKKKPK